jgi:hypothetical protein
VLELFEVLDPWLAVGEHVVDHLARRDWVGMSCKASACTGT